VSGSRLLVHAVMLGSIVLGVLVGTLVYGLLAGG
jgi:hypothetical protein